MPDEEATRRLLRALGITDGTEDRVQADHSNLTTAQWHRAVYERQRYEKGELTDWPDGEPSDSYRDYLFRWLRMRR